VHTRAAGSHLLLKEHSMSNSQFALVPLNLPLKQHISRETVTEKMRKKKRLPNYLLKKMTQKCTPAMHYLESTFAYLLTVYKLLIYYEEG
jgi:hypothetical protein